MELVEDWMYFKKNEDDKWLTKYCRCQSPFLFIYKNEGLKREGKPEFVLIINESLEINKTNDRISFCSFVRIRKATIFKFKKNLNYWIVLTRDGYMTIGKVYHVDMNGNMFEAGKKRKNNKYKKKRTQSSTFSQGFTDECKQNSNQNMAVIATKEHDEIETIYKYDITDIKITHSGSNEVIVEEIDTKQRKAQLQFNTKEDAATFTACISQCLNYLQQYRTNMSSLHPDITGVGKPLFPLTINDKTYDKQYYFISFNQIGIDKWYKLLTPKPINSKIKPLINKLEMNDSSLVNLDEVDEIYDLISRDLNVVGAKTKNMEKISNLSMEKRLTMIHMLAMSNTSQGVHYWICILEKPKNPILVLTLFLKHLDEQYVKKAKFIEEFVENEGLISLLSIHKKLKQDIVMSDGEKTFVELRVLLAKVFDAIASAPPYNETINENKATAEQKLKYKTRNNPLSPTSNNTQTNSRKISINDGNINNNFQDDGIDKDEMIRLYGDTDSENDSTIQSSDNDVKESNDITITSPRRRTSKINPNKTSIVGTTQHNAIIGDTTLPRAIQIRYKSGAEVIFDSEQKEDVIEYLTSSIWGFHETEVNTPDLKPGIAVTKCLITLCLLQPEYAAFITTILLEFTDLGKENDNWWLPLIRTIENALSMYKSSPSILRGDGNMFIIQDQCRNYIFSILTLILTMIDCFDIDDRIFERTLLDSLQFDQLLYDLANNINDKQLHAIIQLYKESKQSDINEIAYSQMEITQEFFEYLRDKTIQNGFHQYFSNILTNLAAIPDDNEHAWNNIEQYVFHWRTKFDTMDQQSITPETPIKINNNNNQAEQIEIKQQQLSEIQIEDLNKDNAFLTISQVDKLDKTETLNNKIENLETENNELNSQYQLQLTRNNELQELLKEYKNKISDLENNKGNKNSNNDSKDDKTGSGNKENNISEEDKKKLEEMKKKEKEESEIREKKNKLVKYKRKKKISENNKKEEKKEEKKEVNNGELPALNEEEQKLVDGWKKRLKMKMPEGAIKHQIKYKAKKPHLLPYVFPKLIPKTQQLPELSDEDKIEVAKYKKCLDMKLPPGSVKLKMKRAKHQKLIPYVFGKPNTTPNVATSGRPSDVKEKPKLKPKVAMLPFHWNKIKEKEMKNTIWYCIYHKYGKDKENQIFELSKLESLFGKPKEAKKQQRFRPKTEQKTNINVIPSEVIVLKKKTRQKVDIFLSGVRMNWKMSRKDICEHITNMNERGLTHDHIEKLISVAPIEKEANEFKKSIKTLSESDMLAKSALFWQELLSVDECIKDRLILWEFKLSFKGLIKEEEEKTDKLNDCIDRIKNDDGFKRVLALALDIGNYVNGGKRQGQAYGFNITTLEKLDQFPRRRNKDGTPVPTMLEYIYTLLRDKYSDSLLWTDNLKILDEAITIDLSVINANLKKFEDSIGLLHKRIQSSDEKQLSGKTFSHKMTPFYEDAVKQLETFTDTVDNLNKKLNKLGQWFDVEDTSNLEFLKQINTFRKTFQSIGPRLDKRKKDAERKAKRGKKLKSMGKKNKGKRKVKGGVAIVGINRRGSILRAVAEKQPLKLDPAGNLMPQWSKGSSAGRSMRGNLRNELQKYNNQIKV